MKINSDFRDLLRSLNAGGVRYLVVGGYAVMTYSEPRFTKDLDIWVDPTPPNAESLLAALAAFGAPIAGLGPGDFTAPNVFYQIGVDPVRIDIMTSLPGLAFAGAWKRKVTVDFGGAPASVLCREDVIASKRATNRRLDKRDVKRLQDRK